MTTTTTTSTRTVNADNVLRLFPEVNSQFAPATQPGARDTDLEGYDAEQIRLMDEVCIVLDDDDVPIGSGSKKICTL